MPALHPIQRLLFLRRRYVRRIILLLLIVCARLHAQNIEGQIVASQFGQFQVPGTGDESLQFSPASCQVSGGGKNFSAFEVGVPVKIVDTNPALTEIDTPTTVFLNACSVAMTTTYPHSTPFYLTSGTGGLQEALSNGIEMGGGPTTVILNADWYTQVKPANPATVLASVKGSTSLGLVDVTTTPYTYYQWNGSNYAAIASAGGATLPSTGIVFANNSSTGATATSPQIVAGLNATPSTLLSPSLLPLGTGSQVGAVKSDGATTSISGSGAISAIPPTGAANLIVATPNGSSGAAAPRAMVAADMPAATSSAIGAVKPDNTTITIAGGVISSVGGGGGAPGGSPTNVQFYGASTFAGDSTFTFNNSSHTLAFQNGTSGATAPAGDNSTKLPNTAAVFNSMPALTAQYFGAYGDAYNPPDGCNTTPSSTTVVCPDGPFVSTDVGKQIWVSGVGAGGAAFHATISAVTNNTTVTVSAAATGTVSNGRAVIGHDDTAAVQACFQYSAINAVPCVLKTLPSPPGGNGLVGYLIGSGGLQFVSNNYLEENSGPNIVGNSQVNGTNLFCEFNGDCISLAGGAIQGVNFSNISIEEDKTQPNSRGIHLNPSTGTFGGGPFTNSNFNNVTVNNPALECLWLDGGGGPGYTYNLPNQYLTFNQFFCNGPPQSHPATLIKMTGQAAQIVFINGQVNGQAWNGTSAPNYPNPMISITEKTTGLGDAPVDVKFYGYTYEVGTQGLYLGNGASNIHFDNGYVENVSSPLIVTTPQGITFSGNHIANSGNIGGVAQIGPGAHVSMRDNYEYGGVAIPAAFAVCTGNNTIDFANNISANQTTTGCATATESTGGGSLTVVGSTASVTATGSFNTILAPGVSPGKTLTMYTPGGMQLTSGGNIAFGNYTAPLTIPAGGSVVLTLLDAGVTWLVTSAPPPALGSPSWSIITAGANTATGAFSTNGSWTFNQSVYMNSSSGAVPMQFGPGSTPGSSSTCIYDDGNFNFNATCNGNRGLFFKGNFASQFIAGFQRDGSSNNVLKIGLDGSLISTGSLTLAAARKGTFTCTAGGTITIANTNETTTSDVVISLNTAGGTISTPPAMKTVTAGTGFTVLCGAADMSTYNYDILN